MPVSLRTRLAREPGVLEQAVQQRPGRGGLGRQFVGPLHLPGDLAFADDQAVEPGGDAEQVPHGVAVAVLVEVRTDRSASSRCHSARKSAIVSSG